MEELIQIMKDAIVSTLPDKVKTIYLYGSVTMNDYQSGWSDIDILCFIDGKLTEQEANELLTLRQTLVQSQENDVFRSFEGAIVSYDDFITGIDSNIVYWGTSGERITNHYEFDVFSLHELINDGVLVWGTDIRKELILPTYSELRNEVVKHYHIIKNCADDLDDSLYSCGWLLDIARGIYTLRTGGIIPKTQAGEWALEQKLCPVPDSLQKALQIRRSPLQYKNDPETKKWLSSLGSCIQQFANTLAAEIERTSAGQVINTNEESLH